MKLNFIFRDIVLMKSTHKIVKTTY